VTVRRRGESVRCRASGGRAAEGWAAGNWRAAGRAAVFLAASAARQRRAARVGWHRDLAWLVQLAGHIGG